MLDLSSTQSAKGTPSSSTTAGGCGMETDTTTKSNPTQGEDSTENNGMEHRIVTTYTLIGLIAVIFAMIQIRRV
jgi:hypothetical protein